MLSIILDCKNKPVRKGKCAKIMKKIYKYDIGISYASEQREYVKNLEISLKKQGITCFIDYNEPERLWGEYIPEELRTIYSKECRMILIIISKEYTEKNYTKFESRIACERELLGESLLIIKMGDFTLPWLNNTYGYLDSSKYTTDEIAGYIKKKLIKKKKIPQSQNY